VHVFDYVVVSVSGLFRFHNYSSFEKVYAALLFVAGLSLRGTVLPACLGRVLGAEYIGWDSSSHLSLSVGGLWLGLVFV